MKYVQKFVFTAVILFLAATAAQATIVSTFSDPAFDGTTPLFYVGPGDLIAGGWSDAQTGLDLEYGVNGGVYNDAFFVFDPIAYTGGYAGGTTGAGEIRFYADNADVLTDDPVLQINFDSANVSMLGVGGVNNFFMSDGVTFSGIIVGTEAGVAASNYADESFAFSFTHQIQVPGGYTATAAFTSSATITEIPEPATLGMLLLGGLACLKRRRK